MMQKLLFGSFIFAMIALSNQVARAQSAVDTNPSVVSAVAPVYSGVIRAVNLQGDFFVEVEIDREGKVVSSDAVGEKRKFMRKILEEAANRWRFAPNEDAEKDAAYDSHLHFAQTRRQVI